MTKNIMDSQENYPYLCALKPLSKEYETFNKIQLTHEPLTIGRGQENTVVITNLDISRKHCVIKKNAQNKWIIVDFSTFGVVFNNKKLTKNSETFLNDNDVLQLDNSGEFLYRFKEFNEGVPRKKIKLDDTVCSDANKVLQEELQGIQLKNVRTNIDDFSLKQKDQTETMKQIDKIKNDFTVEINNLKREKAETEQQKLLIEKQHSALSKVLDDKIAALNISQQKHTKLSEENSVLQHQLIKEKEEFEARLNSERLSKQAMLELLETRIQDLEDLLKIETEKSKTGKERTEQLEKCFSGEKHELNDKIKDLEEKLQVKNEECREFQDNLRVQIQECKSIVEDRNNLKKIIQTKDTALREMEESISKREIELSAIARERIQVQADQSSQVINSLHGDLESMRAQLATAEFDLKSLTEALEKRSGENSLTNQLLESELQCTICAEVFITAVTLNCSHMFCKSCIDTWINKKKECPNCRTRITSMNRTLNIDSLIEKIFESCPEDTKKKREELLKERSSENRTSNLPQPLFVNPGPGFQNEEETESEDSDITPNYVSEYIRRRRRRPHHLYLEYYSAWLNAQRSFPPMFHDSDMDSLDDFGDEFDDSD